MVMAIMPRRGKKMLYCTNDLVEKLAIECARGSYQRSLVEGCARWSGSDIENKWGARYHKSREALAQRLVARGLYLQNYTIDGKKFLIVGIDNDDCNGVDSDDLLDMWI